MPTTVYFATNRVVTGEPEILSSFSSNVTSPSDPNEITYGTAFVDRSDLTADTVGAVQLIRDVGKGWFSSGAVEDLANSGRNLLIFIHGFDNSFENALTRAAFNREWLAESGVAGADTSVVAFSWPSRAKLIGVPFPDLAYRRDQTVAGQSGFHISTFMANLEPIITEARRKGRKAFLLVHSMGNWALQAAVESWFMHGNGDVALFDEVFLAAADEVYNSFEFQPAGRLSSLSRLTKRVSTYYSGEDAVLKLSMAVNLGAKRLGQDGPRDHSNAILFPPARFRTVDCSGYHDYIMNLASSHQYYRRSLAVRANIAAAMK